MWLSQIMNLTANSVKNKLANPKRHGAGKSSLNEL